jgi:hypothetical protein
MPGGSGRSIQRGDMKKELPAGAIKSGTRLSMKKPYDRSEESLPGFRLRKDFINNGLERRVRDRLSS